MTPGALLLALALMNAACAAYAGNLHSAVGWVCVVVGVVARESMLQKMLALAEAARALEAACEEILRDNRQ